jgi:trans-aconitate methyltransferase
MKPTKIPCDYLARDRSRRAEILFSAIRPYLRPAMSYLDIGCGTAPLVRFLDESFPPARYVGIDLNAEAILACRAEHPHHTWHRVRSEDFTIETRYDVLIHTGVNSRRFNDAEIHRRLLSGPHGPPGLVLIESGDYLDGPSDTHEIYEELMGLYHEKGYRLDREDVEVITDFPVPVRRYAVFVSP